MNELAPPLKRISFIEKRILVLHKRLDRLEAALEAAYGEMAILYRKRAEAMSASDLASSEAVPERDQDH